VITVVQLISPAYLDMQRQLHAAPRGYGQRGHKWADVVCALIAEYRATSVLDYGCGQGALGRALRERALPGVRIAEYDPAIAGKDALPTFADLVVATDVLEHIEPDRLDAVLGHLRMLTRKALWLVVSTCETAKILADGRNAHLIVQPGIWWRTRLEACGFTVLPPPASARTKPDKEWIAVVTP
jgi:hypothetical protein